MYAVTREPMMESDREALRCSCAPKNENAWMALTVFVVGLALAIAGGLFGVKGQGIWAVLAVAFFLIGVAMSTFAFWVICTWFGDRHWHVAARERYQELLQVRDAEVVHFRAEAAWRVPEDPFDSDDDRLGVLYRLGRDSFVFTPLYEFSLPDSSARVPAEVRMRRTPPPNAQQLTEFEPVNSETLPLRDELVHFEGLSPAWADDLREVAFVGGELRLINLPMSWKSIVLT